MYKTCQKNKIHYIFINCVKQFSVLITAYVLDLFNLFKVFDENI
jgi:hypothetical protein